MLFRVMLRLDFPNTGISHQIITRYDNRVRILLVYIIPYQKICIQAKGAHLFIESEEKLTKDVRKVCETMKET